TTAAAVTTFDTGASPHEHGILSWFLHLPDVGCVSTVLRTATRVGTPLVPEGFDLAAYVAVPSYVDTVTTRRGLLSFGDIPDLPPAEVAAQWAARRSYVHPAGTVQAMAQCAAEAGRSLPYDHWARNAGRCHVLRCLHPDSGAQFQDSDRALAQPVDALEGQHT